MKQQLVSRNIAGNLHAATDAINAMGLADYVLHLEGSTGHYTIAVFRVPASMAPALRKHFGTLPEYQANPKPERKWP